MTNVVLRRVTLCGFGVYTQPTTFTFNERLNVYVAPNEAGKSTLVAGVAAVLFGLPTSNNPTNFSQARFRSWQPGEGFWGEVEFEAEGKPYIVRRDLESHAVLLRQRQENGAWITLFDEIHNPRSDLAQAEIYVTTMSRLMHVTSHEVFRLTFCVEQPMPDQNGIAAAVQQLVTGSSNRRVDQVLNDLLRRFKALSKATADFGVVLPGKQARNQRNDGEIEQLEADLEQLQARFEGSSETLASLTATQHELHQLDERIQRLEKTLKENESTLGAWDRWQQLRDKRDDAMDKQCKLEDAIDQYQDRDREFKTLRQQIADSYPEFEETPKDLHEQLRGLLRAESELEQLRKRSREWEEQYNELTNLLRQCEETIERQYGAIKDKPDLLRDYDQLRNLVERRDALAERIRDLETQRAALEQERDTLLPWDRLGAHPSAVVEAARERVRRFRDSHRDYEGVSRRLNDVRQRLEGEFEPFLEVGDSDLDAVEHYDFEHQRLLDAQRDAADTLTRVETTTREVESLQRECDEQFGRLAAAPNDLIPSFEKACSLRTRHENVQREHQGVINQLNQPLPDKRLPWMMLGGVIGLLLGAGSWFIWFQAAIAAAIAAGCGVLGLCAVWLFMRRPEHDIALKAQQIELERQLEEMQRDLDELMDGLTEFGEPTPLVLGRLQAEVEQRERLLRRIESLREQLPPQQELESARSRAAETQRDLDTFEMRMNPYVMRFGATVSGAARNCARLREEKARLQQDVQAYEKEFFKVSPGQDLASLKADKLPELWAPIRLLAEVAGATPNTAQEVVRWVLSVGDQDWGTWRSQCDQAEHLAREIARLETQVRTLLAPAGEVTELDRLDGQIDALREKVSPFDESTDRQTIEMEMYDLRVVRRDADRAKHKLADLDAEIDIIERVEQAAARVESLRLPLAGYLAPADNDVERARQRLDAFRELQHGAEKRQAERDGVLAGQGAKDLEDLKKRRVQAKNNEDRFERDLEELRGQHVLIRELERLGEPQEIQRRYQELVERVAGERAELESDNKRYNELSRAFASLQGRDLYNVAALEGELAAKQEHSRRLKQERLAVSTAFELVNQARQEYQEVYRDRLAESITGHFQRLSRNHERVVTLSEDFVIQLQNNDGVEFVMAQLSQGARDQLYLAVRLAVADLLADAVAMPIILDDPFLNYDQHRVPEVRRTLEAIVERQQVILLSHRTDLREWGTPITRQQGAEPVQA